jgi:23S rRNA (uracil1939-C5)-methyltransferase
MQVTIEKLIYGGAGLARTDQGIVFVPKTAPGDVVEIEVTERKKGYSVGALRHIISASNSRKKPTCPNFDSVGCCHWDHIEYEHQVRFKKEIILETLSRLAKVPYGDSIHAISGSEHGYRMRASFHVHDSKLGFVRENTNFVVPIAECAALSTELNRFIPSFNTLRIPASKVDVVSNGSEIAATLRFEGFRPHEPWERWRDALFEIPGLVNITFIADSKRLFYRKSVPTIDVGGTPYRLTADAFFQANRFLLNDFVAQVIKDVGPSPTDVLELFSGSGFFSIPIARRCRQLIGIENDPVAVRHARENLQSNRIGNVEFALGDVDKMLADADLRPNVIVLNPPRTGAGKKVASTIAGMKAERIVYVSCNPTTFAPEMRVLTEAGYCLSQLTLIDQFPSTYHIEMVARFELK